MLYAIPFLADAPPVTALFIPKLPDATFNDLSRLDVFNLAAVTDPSVSFVPETPEILPSVTAELAIAAVSTALSANSLEPIALAAICVAVIVSSSILAAVTALACIAALATWFVPNVPTLAAGISPASICRSTGVERLPSDLHSSFERQYIRR